ncbi:hypothetical protein SDC9_186512 [bioreactor metagenome]|uniref:Uncharacterized protein n=1 Tax=bioreactor metagenome TaxID=1076179 RepID=A0A645HJ40_9ZZZZ
MQWLSTIPKAKRSRSLTGTRSTPTPNSGKRRKKAPGSLRRNRPPPETQSAVARRSFSSCWKIRSTMRHRQNSSPSNCRKFSPRANRWTFAANWLPPTSSWANSIRRSKRSTKSSPPPPSTIRCWTSVWKRPKSAKSTKKSP